MHSNPKLHIFSLFFIYFYPRLIANCLHPVITFKIKTKLFTFIRDFFYEILSYFLLYFKILSKYINSR